MTYLICTAIWHEGRLRRLRLIDAENREPRNTRECVCRKYIEGKKAKEGEPSCEWRRSYL